jgi:hypothetical protein
MVCVVRNVKQFGEVIFQEIGSSSDISVEGREAD